MVLSIALFAPIRYDKIMFWRQLLTPRLTLTLSLFLIASLHTMIFSIFQIPENFLMGYDSSTFSLWCKVVFYVTAVGVSVSNQMICRKIGLKRMLYFGLLFNLLGISTLLINQILLNYGMIALIFLNMLFFGAALTSVINSLVTYIVLEFPKKVGIGIVALFAFLNLGAMLGPILLGLFQSHHIHTFFFPFLIALLLLSLWFVWTHFSDPRFPAHLSHLRKGSLIWKELHYRLGLYVVAIIAYGLTESTFSLWGYINIKDILGAQAADETISFFWLFLIIGQICLLLPLYFLSPKKVFYVLIFVIMGAGYYFSLQETVFGFISGLAVAGFGCSAVFPLLLSMMEKEIVAVAQGRNILYYIEMVISIMIGGYFLGVGLTDLWAELFGHHPLIPLPLHFQLIIVYIGITGFIAFFLSSTFRPKQSK